MKISALTILASSIPSTNALWKGFNLRANLADGSCKTQADWASDFATLQTLQGGPYNSVRLYSSSDCDSLANAVPAAIAAGIKIFAGVWTVDDTHYTNEKNALLTAAQTHGCDWLLGISVASESLYRVEQSASSLAQQIYDVRGMMTTVPGCPVPVGHTDTWTVWTGQLGDVTEVITAVDFLATNGFPYFQTTQDNTIENAYTLFWDSVNAVGAVCQGKAVILAETGWPTTGPPLGKAVPSIANAEAYWKAVACSIFASYHAFWYDLEDYNASPNFGVADHGTPKYDLTC